MGYAHTSTWLWLLTLLFSLRVLGQLIAYYFDIAFLPGFDLWYSGALAYPTLLVTQCLIIFVMLLVTHKINRGQLLPNRTSGMVLLSVGGLYFAAMFIRWIIGLTDTLDIVWFQRPIPAFFHLVLAAFILLVANYHRTAPLHRSSQHE